jgi:hypothetical protein
LKIVGAIDFFRNFIKSYQMKKSPSTIAKFSVFFIASLLLGVFISCNKDSDEPEKDEVPTDFVDQPLAGKIGNSNWTPLTAFKWENQDYANTFTIQMSSTFFEDPCANWSSEGKAISFRVGNTVGLYNINPEFFADHEFVITNSSTEFWEYVSAKVELLTITSETITGRLYAKYNDTNYLTGNFTVEFMCNY